jgi:hypothetical protein
VVLIFKGKSMTLLSLQLDALSIALNWAVWCQLELETSKPRRIRNP